MNEAMDAARRKFASILLQRNVLATMMHIPSASMPADEVSRGRALDKAKLANAIDAMRRFGAATRRDEKDEEKKGMVVAKAFAAKEHYLEEKKAQACR